VYFHFVSTAGKVSRRVAYSFHCNAQRSGSQSTPMLTLPSLINNASRSTDITQQIPLPRWNKVNWVTSNFPPPSPSAEYTLVAPPLSDPPPSEWNLNNVKTLHQFPHRYKIYRRVNSNLLRKLLEDHPNRPLIDSFLKGFETGFWPGSDGVSSEILEKYSKAGNYSSLNDFENEFAETLEKEIHEGRISEGYPVDEFVHGVNGIIPQGSVEKRDSLERRPITDFSFGGNSSINSTIPKSERTVRYDTPEDLINILRHHRIQGNLEGAVNFFKSDMSKAFRHLPMHRLWQLKQNFEFQGKFYVDRCMSFGLGSSPRIFCIFAGLLAWIAINKRGLNHLLHFMDDFFGFDLSTNLVIFKGHLIPKAQATLLELWDELNVMWSWPKQIHGTQIEIVGLWCDSVNNLLSISKDRRTQIREDIQSFINSPNQFQKLKTWQRIIGKINFTLSVFPLLKPGLNSSYRKIAGKSGGHQGVPLNRAVISDLSWIAGCLDSSVGVRFMFESTWSSPDVEIHTDASLVGGGIYCISHHWAQFAKFDLAIHKKNAFLNEALVILAAIETVAKLRSSAPIPDMPLKLLIKSDSKDSVEIWNHLRSSNFKFSNILRLSAPLLISANIDLRIIHIPGVTNRIPDAISRWKFEEAIALDPLLSDPLRFTAFNIPLVELWDDTLEASKNLG
jgi:hypothetical protein